MRRVQPRIHRIVRPSTVWLTGLSGAGKTTIARELEAHLRSDGVATCVLDGDEVRRGLTSDLGYSPADRWENIRRIAEAARLMNDAGLVVVTALISPYRQDRARAREIVGRERFLEVFVDTPLEVCERRDVKGHYARARRGELPQFTGISAPYETPESPDHRIWTASIAPEEAGRGLLAWLTEESSQFISP